MTSLARVSADNDLPLAVTSGDPAGIGPDVTLLAWSRRRELKLPPFYVLSDPDSLVRRARLLGLDTTVETIAPETASAVFATALPVVDIGHRVKGAAGDPSSDDAAAVIASIESGVADIRSGRARAIVTNPIAKHVLYSAHFAYPGHTEFLGDLARGFPAKADLSAEPVMMLAGPDLKTVPVTVHVALTEAISALSTERIVKTGRIVARELALRFGIAAPRIAVAGLNPHAGERGGMGHEDIDIIEPAITRLRAEGIDAFGPLPADTLFHAAARLTYDVALCMYHDQALIPVKTIAFDETVNVTLGLPFVRTSPDHGTAFDIAGTGRARPGSFAAALRLADRLTLARPAIGQPAEQA